MRARERAVASDNDSSPTLIRPEPVLSNVEGGTFFREQEKAISHGILIP